MNYCKLLRRKNEMQLLNFLSTFYLCAKLEKSQLPPDARVEKLKQLGNCILFFVTQQFAIVQSPNAIVRFAFFLLDNSGVSGRNSLQ